MSSQTENGKTLNYRLALEALRNGVPNRAAVKILGCNQPEAERRFEEMLSAASDGDNPPRSCPGNVGIRRFRNGQVPPAHPPGAPRPFRRIRLQHGGH